MSRIRHGGDITAAEAKFPTPKNGWLDLSTGINPVPYPVETSDVQGWFHLPTNGDEVRLIDAARAYYGVPGKLELVAAPGTQALIQWLPRLRPPGTVDIVSPTYGEHAHCWAHAGHQVREVDDLAEADADVVIVVNPNNPDGRSHDRHDLAGMLETQQARGGWLIVDEAFGDLTPDSSATTMSSYDGLIILKSFGKFFGLAGVRLGFAVTGPEIANSLSSALGPWAVPGPAISIGCTAFGNIDWQRQTRTRLTQDAARLDQLLSRAGFTVIGGTTLFRLADVGDAEPLYDRLGNQGILVRIFDANPAWARFGFPGDASGWARLEAALY